VVVKDGVIGTPERAGLGMELNKGKIEREEEV
jgi:hypothetical protein